MFLFEGSDVLFVSPKSQNIHEWAAVGALTVHFNLQRQKLFTFITGRDGKDY